MSFLMKGTRPVSLSGKDVFRLSDATFTFCAAIAPGTTSKEIDRLGGETMDATAKPAVAGGEANPIPASKKGGLS